MMHDLMVNHVMEAYREQADRFADLHTVAERMRKTSADCYLPCEARRSGKNITMEIVPTDDYGPESRTGFLYIKEC